MTEFLPKAVNALLGILMIFIVGLCLFGTGADYAYKKTFALPNIGYMLLGIVCLLGISCLTNWLGKYLERCRWSNLIMLLGSIGFFFLLVFLTYHYYFKTGWDAQVVEGTARLVSVNQEEVIQKIYFSYYPNNVFLVFLFSIVIRMGALVGITNYYYCIVTAQCFLFVLTGFVLYQAAVLRSNERVGLSVWSLYVFLVGLSPWVVIPYSDASGLLFPVLLYYLYLRICEGKQIWLCAWGMTFLCVTGYHIKPQIVIVGIAVFIITVLTFQKKWLAQKKLLLGSLLAAVIGLTAGFGLVNVCVEATHIDINEELAHGMSHFLMLGLNEEYGGVINIVDQDFSRSFDNVKERSEGNWQVIGQRLKDMGPVGLLGLWKNKMLTNFADGTFAWWMEGDFYTERMYEGNPVIRGHLTSYFYEGEARHELFKNHMQMLWMGTLFFGMFSVLTGGRKETGREEQVLKLAIIGIILFEMIFEARARYLFVYAPFFVLLACRGVDLLLQRVWSCKWIETKRKKVKGYGQSSSTHSLL